MTAGMRTGARCLGGLGLALAIVAAAVSTVHAQAPPGVERGEAEDENATGPDSASSAAQGRAVGAWPRAPVFFRGNGPGDAGHYLSMARLLLVLGLFVLWVRTSWWVDRDSRALNVDTEFWNSLTLVCGVAGFLAVFCLPVFLLGLPALLAFCGVPLGLYIQDRNKRVPESSRVMTPKHLRTVAIRALARFGIRIGSSQAVESALGAPITFIGRSSTGRGDDENRSRQVENSKGFLAAKELVYDAILRRSTDIHLEPKDDEMSVRLRIDGVMYPVEPFSRAIGDATINIFKVLSAMDITERRRPQDGSFRAEMEDREVDFRVATQGTRHGEKLSLRILDQTNSVSRLTELGFRKAVYEQMREIIHQPHGLLLACGPTGAGKSTTLYACLNDIDSLQQNIITVEDPIEYKMGNVNQIEINTKAGQTFATSLRSILRQDPDVVMVGEIRDGETATIACQAANTGHMVFSTVHANDTYTALYRMIELGVEPYMVANSLSGIIGQRLARRLCTECREAYRPKPELLQQAGLPVDKIEAFYRPAKNPQQPCLKCGGLGYFGRVGVYELLVVTDRMRDMIRDKASVTAIKAEARKNGMLTMKEEGLRLVARGITSIEELLRVVK